MFNIKGEKEFWGVYSLLIKFEYYFISVWHSQQTEILSFVRNNNNNDNNNNNNQNSNNINKNNNNNNNNSKL